MDKRFKSLELHFKSLKSARLPLKNNVNTILLIDAYGAKMPKISMCTYYEMGIIEVNSVGGLKS